jgi:hypothetical protein
MSLADFDIGHLIRDLRTRIRIGDRDCLYQLRTWDIIKIDLLRDLRSDCQSWINEPVGPANVGKLKTAVRLENAAVGNGIPCVDEPHSSFIGSHLSWQGWIGRGYYGIVEIIIKSTPDLHMSGTLMENKISAVEFDMCVGPNMRLGSVSKTSPEKTACITQLRAKSI